MRTFKIEIIATGSHGVDRAKKDGEIVDFKQGGEFTPDAIASRLVAELNHFGYNIAGAKITHWPGESFEVVDDFLTGERKGNF